MTKCYGFIRIQETLKSLIHQVNSIQMNGIYDVTVPDLEVSSFRIRYDL